jgi:hypothetical protein
MRQYEAVIKVMEDNDGFATLGHLYQHALKIPNVGWKTRTPFASIRRIVQDERFFFKIRPGLWALKSCKNNVLKQLSLDTSSKEQQEKFNHSYFQGLVVEIGNLLGHRTFVPHQDKNKLYLSKPLSHYISIHEYLDFTYKCVIEQAITIDVSWFNNRDFPDSFFEIEHTTPIDRSLLKFVELQDFNAKFYIVASDVRRREFERRVSMAAFGSIKNRVNFIDYEALANHHSAAFQAENTKKAVFGGKNTD